MTDDERAQDARGNEPLRRVLARPGGKEALDLLVDGLSGADLTTLLLEVYRRRAERLTPADVMRRYRSDRFVAPAPTDPRLLRRVEDALFSALPEGFEPLVLAPLLPLAAHSAVGTVDPRKVVATVRTSEVAADPTNGLALEAAERRSRALAADPRSAQPVRLAATQRVTRAQHFGDVAGMLAHFHLFALVTAGRDTGAHAFEQQHLIEHLRFVAAASGALGTKHTEIRLTALDEPSTPLIAHARAALSETSGVDVVDDPDRPTGRGYYTGLCYKLFATVDGASWEIGDGGFVDWTGRLVGSRKERLLITGLGLDRLTAVR